MEDQEVTLEEIERAAAVLKGVTRVTPLDRSNTLSELTGIDLYLKMENFQRSGSFKMRGAYYKIHSLPDSERKRGVVAASAGNHAQGVAHAATLLGVKATIVMPESASPAKVDATKGYGARVVLHGAGFRSKRTRLSWAATTECSLTRQTWRRAKRCTPLISYFAKETIRRLGNRNICGETRCSCARFRTGS